MSKLELIETAIFTEDIEKYLTFSEYRAFQLELIESPEKGKLIQGTGGARKIRFGASGKGKSGGIRVIYYYKIDEKIFLLLAYKKSTQENLTEKQKSILKTLIEGIK